MDKKFYLRKYFHFLIKINAIIIISALIFSCAEPIPEQNESSSIVEKSLGNQLIANAVWNSQTSRITLEGIVLPGGGQVDVYDGEAFNTFLGMADVELDGSWKLEIFSDDFNSIPCDIYIVTDNSNQKLPIVNAPSTCSPIISSIQSRVVITASNPPNGSIDSPPGSSIDVVKGNSLTFDASAIDPDGDTNFTFIWDFGSYSLRKVGRKINVTFNQTGIVNVALLVRDSTGTWDPTRDSIIVNVVSSGGGSGGGGVGNTSPNGIITKPSSNQNIIVGDSVRFESTGTDPQGRQLNYAWSFPGSGISSSTKQNPGKLKFSRAGTFNVRLTVTNDLGIADSTPDTVRITVSTGNTVSTAPDGIIVSPSNSGFFITAGDTLTLMGSASGSDDEDLIYTWDVGAYGPQKTGQNVEMTFNRLGPVTLKLFVKNKKNAADLTPAIITFNVVQIVAASNSAPFSEIVSPSSNQTINAGQAVFFSGNALDPDGDMPLHFLWDFDGALPFSTAQTPGAVIFTTPGVYRVTMRSIDSLGQADQTPDSRVITVNGTVTSPPDTFIDSPANNLTIRVGSSINFSGSATDPDFDMPYSFLWNFAGVAPPQTVATPGAIKFETAGVFTISLRAGDASGAKDPTPATVQITVTNLALFNEPPETTIITPSLDMEVFEGDSLEFLGTGVDPEGGNLNYFWDFDASRSNMRVINPGFVHFTREGVYNISLTATDQAGLSDPTPATVRITVKAPPSNVAPNGTITSPNINRNINEGDSLTFSGFGTDPDGNTPLTYLWNFDGAVPNLRTNTPGKVTFATPGVYRVRLTVTDATGLKDPTPAERVIVVDAVNRPNGNLAPNAVIMTPSANTQVTIGESLGFTGAGIDPDGNLPLTYRWNFDGVIPNSIAQNPGLVTFTQVGTYRIVLSTTDTLGSADPTPAERLITVIGNATTNVSPSASIVFPRSTQNIAVNGVINFRGAGSDPNNNTPLSYMWDFDGAVPNIVGQDPGNVTFKKVGTYVVSLNVIDSLGAVSNNSPSITVIVGETTGGNTGGGGTGSGSNANWEILSPTNSVLNLNIGSTYTFEGSKQGADGRISTFSFWNFDGYFSLNSIGNSVTKTFNKPGTITLKYYSKAATGTFALPDTRTVIIQ